MTGPIREWVLRFYQDRHGIAAVEFALVAPILVILMLGTYDLGNAAQQQIALQAAVQVGGAYAVHLPDDPTGVQAAVTAALPAGMTLINPGGVAAVACSCSGVTGTFVCSAQPSACTAPMTLRITADIPYTTLTTLFSGIITNEASYVVRYH